MAQISKTAIQPTEKETPNPRNITVPKKNPVIQFTHFTGADKAILTKQFSTDNDGSIKKQSQPLFSSGQAKTLEINQLRDIEKTVSELETNQCISTGTVTTRPLLAKNNQNNT